MKFFSDFFVGMEQECVNRVICDIDEDEKEVLCE